MRIFLWIIKSYNNDFRCTKYTRAVCFCSPRPSYHHCVIPSGVIREIRSYNYWHTQSAHKVTITYICTGPAINVRVVQIYVLDYSIKTWQKPVFKLYLIHWFICKLVHKTNTSFWNQFPVISQVEVKFH